MGLDADFLSMLTASVGHESVMADQDLWGNDAYTSPVTRKCFIEQITQEYGIGQEGREVETRQARVASLITDAVGMKIADRLTIGTDKFWIRQVDTFKDEFGVDLYQQVQAVDQKE